MQINDNVNAMRNFTTQMNQNADNMTQTTVGNLGNATDSKEAVTQAEQTNYQKDDVSRILTDEITIENGLDAQIRSVNTQNQMLGSLLDTSG